MFSCSPQAAPASQHDVFLVARDPARGGTLFAHGFMRLPPELIPTTPEPFVEAFLRPSIEWKWDNGMPGLGPNKEDIYAMYTVYAYNM